MKGLRLHCAYLRNTEVILQMVVDVHLSTEY